MRVKLNPVAELEGTGAVVTWFVYARKGQVLDCPMGQYATTWLFPTHLERRLPV